MAGKAAKLHWSLRESTRRLIESIAPILQITLAAIAAYAVGRYVFGHQVPLFAVTVTITSLGFTRDARPRRIAETGLGMITGIALSEVISGAVGTGIWQLALVILAAMIVARFITGSSAFALAATIQAILVVLIAPPPGGPFVRTLDALLGGTMALLVTALIPRDPRGQARTDAEKLFAVFTDSVEALRLALIDSDVKVADYALGRVRRTQPLVDNWRMSLDSAVSIARISPFLRKYQDELRGQVRLLRGMDLATRNLRVVVRRIDFLLRDGKPRPYLADLLEQILEATRVLQQGLEDPKRLDEAEELFVGITHQLDPKRHGVADQVREASVVLLLRPMLVDLMCAAGRSEEDARAELPEV